MAFCSNEVCYLLSIIWFSELLSNPTIRQWQQHVWKIRPFTTHRLLLVCLITVQELFSHKYLSRHNDVSWSKLMSLEFISSFLSILPRLLLLEASLNSSDCLDDSIVYLYALHHWFHLCPRGFPLFITCYLFYFLRWWFPPSCLAFSQVQLFSCQICLSFFVLFFNFDTDQWPNNFKVLPILKNPESCFICNISQFYNLTTQEAFSHAISFHFSRLLLNNKKKSVANFVKLTLNLKNEKLL